MNSEDFKLTPERLEEYHAAQRDAQKARWVTHMRSSDTSFADRLEGLSQDEQDAFTDRMYEIGLGKHRMMSSASHYAEGNKRMRAAVDAMPMGTPPNPANPLSKQIDGGHYKDLKIQPIEYIHANNIPFAEGCAIKYLTRWRAKGGIKDLEKAKHFIDLLIELESR